MLVFNCFGFEIAYHRLNYIIINSKHYYQHCQSYTYILYLPTIIFPCPSQIFACILHFSAYYAPIFTADVQCLEELSAITVC